MPLILTKGVSEDMVIGIWKITETSINDFHPRLIGIDKITEKYASGKRRLELMSTHALLYATTNYPNGTIIEHEESGKPTLPGCNISISHTKGYASLIISKTKNVAIDIESIGPKVDRVAKMFIREDEIATDTASRLIHWCAKETLYKYFSKERLSFKDMKITIGRSIDQQGTLLARNLKSSIDIKIHYEDMGDFMLAYTL